MRLRCRLPSALAQKPPVSGTVPAAVEQQYGKAVLTYLESGELNKPSTVITGHRRQLYGLVPKAREVRPLSVSELQTAQQKAYTDWLDGGQG